MIVRTLAGALGAAACLTLAAPAFALDLTQAYREAMANDTQVASARAQFAAIRERVPQARAAMLPQVGASATVAQQYVNTDLAPSRTFLGQNYAIQLSYPLYRPQNFELLEQSKLQALLGESQFRQAQQDLIVRVAQAYFDTLAAQDNVGTIQAQKRAISEQLASAKRNFEVGTATITDQQEAQARYDLTVAQEVAAQNELEVRRAALAQLIGRPVDNLDVLRPGVTLKGAEPARESDWTEGARRDNYAVQQAQIAGEIARREIDRQRFARYPTLDLFGSVGHSRSETTALVRIPSNNASVGVQLAIPIYTGGAIDSRVREAAASHEQALADLETTRRAAEQAARQAFLGLNSGLGQVRALEAAERSSQLALDSNLLGYQVGVRINIDVLNAQQQLFTTRRDLARARYDVIVNGLQLKSTAGTLDEADVELADALLVPASSLPPAPPPPRGPSGERKPGSVPPLPGSAPPLPGSVPPAGGVPGTAPEPRRR